MFNLISSRLPNTQSVGIDILSNNVQCKRLNRFHSHPFKHLYTARCSVGWHSQPLNRHSHPFAVHRQPLNRHSHPFTVHRQPLNRQVIHSQCTGSHSIGSHLLTVHRQPLNRHSHLLTVHRQPLNRHSHLWTVHRQPLNRHNHLLTVHSQPINRHSHLLTVHRQPLNRHSHPFTVHSQPLRQLAMTSIQRRFGTISTGRYHNQVNQTVRQSATWHSSLSRQ